MKKFLGILFSILFVVCPLIIKAEETEKIDISKYKTLNYVQTLNDEDIAKEFNDYEETDDQITIYMFRGKGCGFCRSFLNFMNDITTEYGNYFKMVSFETWYDSDNGDLLDTISSFMGQKASGVPYIIIGDKSFPGYTDTYNEEIKQAIVDLYNSKDRYDVFEKYNESIDEANKAKNAGFNKVIIWNLVFTLLASCSVVLYVKSQNKKIMDKLEELNNKTVAKVQKTDNLVATKKAVKKPNAKKK